MRKHKSLLLLAGALLAVLVLAAFTGCEKLGGAKVRASENGYFEVPIHAGTEKDGEYIIGKVQVWDDGENLYLKYLITEADWWITQTHVQVGFSMDTVPMNKQGVPIPGKFDWNTTHDPSVKYYEYTIPFPADYDPDDPDHDEFFIVAHCVLEKWVDGELVEAQTGFGGDKEGPGKRWWWYFWYTPGYEPDPTPQLGSETAYGGGEYVAPPGWFYWFDWVVGTEGTATYDLWAGQWYDCGKVTAEEVDGYLRVTYVVEASEDFDWVGMTEAHLYYGECPMPYTKRPIPGQAPYKWTGDLTESYYFDLPLEGYEAGDCLYVIPHAKVWFETEAEE